MSRRSFTSTTDRCLRQYQPRSRDSRQPASNPVSARDEWCTRIYVANTLPPRSLVAATVIVGTIGSDVMLCFGKEEACDPGGGSDVQGCWWGEEETRGEEREGRGKEKERDRREDRIRVAEEKRIEEEGKREREREDSEESMRNRAEHRSAHVCKCTFVGVVRTNVCWRSDANVVWSVQDRPRHCRETAAILGATRSGERFISAPTYRSTLPPSARLFSAYYYY